MEGKWLRESKNGRAIVFIHGLFSSSETAWQSENAYWPDLVLKEEKLLEYGVYLFGYDTSLSSTYYSIDDAVDALHAYAKLHHLWDMAQIMFVAHSMGGLVSRGFVVKRQLELFKRQMQVGLFLVASPSLGSAYANFFHNIGLIYHAQLDALRFSQQNLWLNALDDDFRDLKEARQFPIFGKELIEANPTRLPRWGFGDRQIVTPKSAAVYFGDALKIPGSNHVTIAKPPGSESLQHLELVRFIVESGALFADQQEKDKTSSPPPLLGADPPSATVPVGTALDPIARAALGPQWPADFELPVERSDTSTILTVAGRLAGGRMFERMAASWLAKRHGDPVALVRAALATGDLLLVERAALWLRFAPKQPSRGAGTLAQDAVAALGVGPPDSVRLTAKIAGCSGDGLAVPRVDLDDEWELRKYGFYCHKAHVAAASLSNDPESIGYNIRRAIEIACARQVAGMPLHFLDHVAAFRFASAANGAVMLEELVKNEAPEEMTGALLRRLASAPNQKSLERLCLLAASPNGALRDSARMALAFLPARSDAVRAAKSAALRDVDAAYAVAVAVDQNSAARAVLNELLAAGGPVGVRHAAAWALGRIASEDEQVRPAVAVASIEHSDEIVRAILLAEMATYDPASAEPLVRDMLPAALGLERLLLAIAQSYDGDPIELMTTLSSTSEAQIYVPSLPPPLQDQFSRAFEHAAKSAPLIGEWWRLGDVT